MNEVAAIRNYKTDTLLIGFSDLVALRNERPMVLTAGRGVFVTDENGREYLEAMAGFCCAALGYNDQELVEAATRQMRMLPFSPAAYNRTVPVVLELAERLAEISPIPGAHVAFATSGSEINDTMIKFAWHANVGAGQPKRRKIISRIGGYHGNTALTNALGGTPEHHEAFGLPMHDHLHVSQPVAQPGEDEAAMVERLAAELRATIEQAGPETVAIFIAEPVSFAADVCIPPPSYFPRLQDVLNEYGILMYSDEVITGFGRTGEFWAGPGVGVVPDVMMMSKGLSSAYQPIAASLMAPQFYERLEFATRKSGWLAHAGTSNAHPVAAAVALKVLDIFKSRDIMGHVQRVLPEWQKQLAAIEDHPLVSGTRSIGLMAGVTLHPGDLAKDVYQAAMHENLMIRPGTNMIKMTPPLIISQSEIVELFVRLRRALDRVLHGKQNG
jgi:4-aminobutyrate--pyruvate transaminase